MGPYLIFIFLLAGILLYLTLTQSIQLEQKQEIKLNDLIEIVKQVVKSNHEEANTKNLSPMVVVEKEVRLEEGTPIGAIILTNATEKDVVSVKYTIICLDSFGQPAGNENKVEVVKQDHKIPPNDTIEEIIYLDNNPETRKIKVLIMAVLFADDSLWQKEDAEYLEDVKISIEELLEKGLDINQKDENGWTGLHHAVEKGNVALASLLIEKGAKTSIADNQGRTPFHLSVRDGNLDMAGTLIDKDVDVDLPDQASGKTPLHFASERGHVEVIALLLSKGANLDVFDDEERTPLHSAVRRENLEIVEVLLERVDKSKDFINKKDKEGKTALHYATENGDLEIVKILLKKGAYPDISDKYGRNPVHFAADRQYERIVKLLLIVGLNVNVPDKFFRKTPLHFAAERGNLEIVKMLVESGAELNIKNILDETPMDRAGKRGHLDVEKYLKEAGTVKEEVTFSKPKPFRY